MMNRVCNEKDIVLVVDDEKTVEEMIEAMVEAHGCAHVSFNNPVEALNYYKENSRKITLIITDLTMPFLSGPELIRKVLQINPKLPVILVTGYLAEQVPADIPPLVRRIVRKPFTKSEIVDAVQTAFAEARNEDHTS
jgi:FixJ family two-component response regulator